MAPLEPADRPAGAHDEYAGLIPAAPANATFPGKLATNTPQSAAHHPAAIRQPGEKVAGNSVKGLVRALRLI